MIYIGKCNGLPNKRNYCGEPLKLQLLVGTAIKSCYSFPWCPCLPWSDSIMIMMLISRSFGFICKSVSDKYRGINNLQCKDDLPPLQTR